MRSFLSLFSTANGSIETKNGSHIIAGGLNGSVIPIRPAKQRSVVPLVNDFSMNLSSALSISMAPERVSCRTIRTLQNDPLLSLLELRLPEVADELTYLISDGGTNDICGTQIRTETDTDGKVGYGVNVKVLLCEDLSCDLLRALLVLAEYEGVVSSTLLGERDSELRFPSAPLSKEAQETAELLVKKVTLGNDINDEGTPSTIAPPDELTSLDAFNSPCSIEESNIQDISSIPQFPVIEKEEADVLQCSDLRIRLSNVVNTVVRFFINYCLHGDQCNDTWNEEEMSSLIATLTLLIASQHSKLGMYIVKSAHHIVSSLLRTGMSVELAERLHRSELIRQLTQRFRNLLSQEDSQHSIDEGNDFWLCGKLSEEVGIWEMIVDIFSLLLSNVRRDSIESTYSLNNVNSENASSNVFRRVSTSGWQFELVEDFCLSEGPLVLIRLVEISSPGQVVSLLGHVLPVVTISAAAILREGSKNINSSLRALTATDFLVALLTRTFGLTRMNIASTSSESMSDTSQEEYPKSIEGLLTETADLVNIGNRILASADQGCNAEHVVSGISYAFLLLQSNESLMYSLGDTPQKKLQRELSGVGVGIAALFPLLILSLTRVCRMETISSLLTTTHFIFQCTPCLNDAPFVALSVAGSTFLRRAMTTVPLSTTVIEAGLKAMRKGEGKEVLSDNLDSNHLHSATKILELRRLFASHFEATCGSIDLVTRVSPKHATSMANSGLLSAIILPAITVSTRGLTAYTSANKTIENHVEETPNDGLACSGIWDDFESSLLRCSLSTLLTVLQAQTNNTAKSRLLSTELMTAMVRLMEASINSPVEAVVTGTIERLVALSPPCISPLVIEPLLKRNSLGNSPCDKPLLTLLWRCHVRLASMNSLPNPPSMDIARGVEMNGSRRPCDGQRLALRLLSLVSNNEIDMTNKDNQFIQVVEAVWRYVGLCVLLDGSITVPLPSLITRLALSPPLSHLFNQPYAAVTQEAAAVIDYDCESTDFGVLRKNIPRVVKEQANEASNVLRKLATCYAPLENVSNTHLLSIVCGCLVALPSVAVAVETLHQWIDQLEQGDSPHLQSSRWAVLSSSNWLTALNVSLLGARDAMRKALSAPIQRLIRCMSIRASLSLRGQLTSFQLSINPIIPTLLFNEFGTFDWRRESGSNEFWNKISMQFLAERLWRTSSQLVNGTSGNEPIDMNTKADLFSGVAYFSLRPTINGFESAKLSLQSASALGTVALWFRLPLKDSQSSIDEELYLGEVSLLKFCGGACKGLQLSLRRRREDETHAHTFSNHSTSKYSAAKNSSAWLSEDVTRLNGIKKSNSPLEALLAASACGSEPVQSRCVDELVLRSGDGKTTAVYLARDNFLRGEWNLVTLSLLRSSLRSLPSLIVTPENNVLPPTNAPADGSIVSLASVTLNGHRLAWSGDIAVNTDGMYGSPKSELIIGDSPRKYSSYEENTEGNESIENCETTCDSLDVAGVILTPGTIDEAVALTWFLSGPWQSSDSGYNSFSSISTGGEMLSQRLNNIVVALVERRRVKQAIQLLALFDRYTSLNTHSQNPVSIIGGALTLLTSPKKPTIDDSNLNATRSTGSAALWKSAITVLRGAAVYDILGAASMMTSSSSWTERIRGLAVSLSTENCVVEALDADVINVTIPCIPTAPSSISTVASNTTTISSFWNSASPTLNVPLAAWTPSTPVSWLEESTDIMSWALLSAIYSGTSTGTRYALSVLSQIIRRPNICEGYSRIWPILLYLLHVIGPVQLQNDSLHSIISLAIGGVDSLSETERRKLLPTKDEIVGVGSEDILEKDNQVLTPIERRVSRELSDGVADVSSAYFVTDGDAAGVLLLNAFVWARQPLSRVVLSLQSLRRAIRDVRFGQRNLNTLSGQDAMRRLLVAAFGWLESGALQNAATKAAGINRSQSGNRSPREKQKREFAYTVDGVAKLPSIYELASFGDAPQPLLQDTAALLTAFAGRNPSDEQLCCIRSIILLTLPQNDIKLSYSASPNTKKEESSGEEYYRGELECKAMFRVHLLRLLFSFLCESPPISSATSTSERSGNSKPTVGSNNNSLLLAIAEEWAEWLIVVFVAADDAATIAHALRIWAALRQPHATEQQWSNIFKAAFGLRSGPSIALRAALRTCSGAPIAIMLALAGLVLDLPPAMVVHAAQFRDIDQLSALCDCVDAPSVQYEKNSTSMSQKDNVEELWVAKEKIILVRGIYSLSLETALDGSPAAVDANMIALFITRRICTVTLTNAYPKHFHQVVVDNPSGCDKKNDGESFLAGLSMLRSVMGSHIAALLAVGDALDAITAEERLAGVSYSSHWSDFVSGSTDAHCNSSTKPPYTATSTEGPPVRMPSLKRPTDDNLEDSNSTSYHSVEDGLLSIASTTEWPLGMSPLGEPSDEDASEEEEDTCGIDRESRLRTPHPPTPSQRRQARLHRLYDTLLSSIADMLDTSLTVTPTKLSDENAPSNDLLGTPAEFLATLLHGITTESFTLAHCSVERHPINRSGLTADHIVNATPYRLLHAQSVVPSWPINMTGEVEKNPQSTASSPHATKLLERLLNLPSAFHRSSQNESPPVRLPALAAQSLVVCLSGAHVSLDLSSLRRFAQFTKLLVEDLHASSPPMSPMFSLLIRMLRIVLGRGVSVIQSNPAAVSLTEVTAWLALLQDQIALVLYDSSLDCLPSIPPHSPLQTPTDLNGPTLTSATLGLLTSLAWTYNPTPPGYIPSHSGFTDPSAPNLASGVVARWTAAALRSPAMSRQRELPITAQLLLPDSPYANICHLSRTPTVFLSRNSSTVSSTGSNRSSNITQQRVPSLSPPHLSYPSSVQHSGMPKASGELFTAPYFAQASHLAAWQDTTIAGLLPWYVFAWVAEWWDSSELDCQALALQVAGLISSRRSNWLSRLSQQAMKGRLSLLYTSSLCTQIFNLCPQAALPSSQTTSSTPIQSPGNVPTSASSAQLQLTVIGAALSAKQSSKTVDDLFRQLASYSRLDWTAESCVSSPSCSAPQSPNGVVAISDDEDLPNEAQSPGYLRRQALLHWIHARMQWLEDRSDYLMRWQAFMRLAVPNITSDAFVDKAFISEDKEDVMYKADPLSAGKTCRTNLSVPVLVSPTEWQSITDTSLQICSPFIINSPMYEGTHPDIYTSSVKDAPDKLMPVSLLRVAQQLHNELVARDLNLLSTGFSSFRALESRLSSQAISWAQLNPVSVTEKDSSTSIDLTLPKVHERSREMKDITRHNTHGWRHDVIAVIPTLRSRLLPPVQLQFPPWAVGDTVSSWDTLSESESETNNDLTIKNSSTVVKGFVEVSVDDDLVLSPKLPRHNLSRRRSVSRLDEPALGSAADLSRLLRTMSSRRLLRTMPPTPESIPATEITEMEESKGYMISPNAACRTGNECEGDTVEGSNLSDIKENISKASERPLSLRSTVTLPNSPPCVKTSGTEKQPLGSSSSPESSPDPMTFVNAATLPSPSQQARIAADESLTLRAIIAGMLAPADLTVCRVYSSSRIHGLDVRRGLFIAGSLSLHFVAGIACLTDGARWAEAELFLDPDTASNPHITELFSMSNSPTTTPVKTANPSPGKSVEGNGGIWSNDSAAQLLVATWNEVNDDSLGALFSLQTSNIHAFWRRRYQLRPTALEIVSREGRGLLIAFESLASLADILGLLLRADLPASLFSRLLGAQKSSLAALADSLLQHSASNPPSSVHHSSSSTTPHPPISSAISSSVSTPAPTIPTLSHHYPAPPSWTNFHGTSIQSYARLMTAFLAALTPMWQNGEISNLDYILYLNFLAGRSFLDLTQYPVVPWVLADYSSPTLDLSSRHTFRDLRKPMGAQSEKRSNQFMERYRLMEELYSTDRPGNHPRPFHYGTHYSCAAYVLDFLVRVSPFSEWNRQLHDGVGDVPDRCFHNIEASWMSASSENLQDVRELIPEFYIPSMETFLADGTGSCGAELGMTQHGESIACVTLPRWAGGSARRFLRLHRAALESRYVSENLHFWVDLIFGVAQRGEAAIDAQNMFVDVTYEGTVNLEALEEDPILRRATLGQIQHFGQTPSQLFQTPHAKKVVPRILKWPSGIPTSQITTNMSTKIANDSALTTPNADSTPLLHPAPRVISANLDHNSLFWHERLAPPLSLLGTDKALRMRQLAYTRREELFSVANVSATPKTAQGSKNTTLRTNNSKSWTGRQSLATIGDLTLNIRDRVLALSSGAIFLPLALTSQVITTTPSSSGSQWMLRLSGDGRAIELITHRAWLSRLEMERQLYSGEGGTTTTSISPLVEGCGGSQLLRGLHVSTISAFTVDGNILATAGTDHTIRLWKFTSPTSSVRQTSILPSLQIVDLIPITAFRSYEAVIHSLVLVTSLNLLVALTVLGELLVWDTAQQLFIRRLIPPSTKQLSRDLGDSNLSSRYLSEQSGNVEETNSTCTASTLQGDPSCISNERFSSFSVEPISGHIAASTSSQIFWYDSNGSLIATHSISPLQQSPISTILAVPTLPWRDSVTCVTGHCDGHVCLWKLAPNVISEKKVLSKETKQESTSEGESDIASMILACPPLTTHTRRIDCLKLATPSHPIPRDEPILRVYESLRSTNLIIGDVSGEASRWVALRPEELPSDLIADIYIDHSP